VLRTIGARLLTAVPMLFVICTLTFFLVSAIPGDPVASILGPDASPEQYEVLRAKLGLDQPLWSQYISWMGAVAVGDLGNSIGSGQNVLALISERMPVTVTVAVLAVIVTLVLGVAIGLAASFGPAGSQRAVQVLAVVGASLPNFWIGIVFVLIFAISLAWLPATGFVRFDVSPAGWAQSLILPVAAVAVAGVAAIARQTRSAVLDVLSRDFVRTLLASGTPRSEIIVRHVLRNAAIPIVTITSFLFINLLSGAIVVEQVFAMPGLGSAILGAIAAKDLPVVQGAVVVTAALVILVNLVTDILIAYLNPKARMS
jgi:peptide/nickel transport system permease protein